MFFVVLFCFFLFFVFVFVIVVVFLHIVNDRSNDVLSGDIATQILFLRNVEVVSAPPHLYLNQISHDCYTCIERVDETITGISICG